MTRDEFIERYLEFAKTALAFAAKARAEGLLMLDRGIDGEKEAARDVFHYGMRFVAEAVHPEIIEKILSNIIEQEKDEYGRRFKSIQKEAVLGIQNGYSPGVLHRLLNSYTDVCEEYESLIEAARTPPDAEAVAAALEKAESGDAVAQYRLGKMYLEISSQFADKDYAEAVEWISKAAAQGYGDAQKELDRLKSLEELYATDDETEGEP